MSFMPYVAPEQLMKDRSEYAHKGIARGRSVVGLEYADGLLFLAENPSATLHKISEVYDRIAFAGVGKYSEFEELRIAGIRLADMRGYQYGREDVKARDLANAYSQALSTIFTQQMKPYEIELLVGEVDGEVDGSSIYHILFDGSVTDEQGCVAMGGHAEELTDALRERYADGADLAAGDPRGRRRARRGPGDRARSRPTRSRRACSTGPATDRRKFRRLTAEEIVGRARRLSRLPAFRPPPAVGCLDVDRRIFGLENEYGVTCTFRGQRRLSPDEVARYLFRRVVHWGRSSNVFLENGARLYLDVGSHPEYATPECDDVRELVAHDKAGERILESLLAAAEVRLHEEGISGDVYLFKNNTDSAGNSYGCHENYLVARQGEFARMADVLIPFFVTRQIWCGAGKVLHGPRGAQYCLAQRAEHIWEGVSSATTRSRPIINTRDEPHADAERYRRLHVIVGDSNMSEWTTFMKVGITDLVLRMVEANTVMRDLSLENPIRAIREISHDLTCTRKVKLANGRELSALEVQTEYFEKTSRFIERRGADETATVLLAEWEAALDGAPRRRRPSGSCARWTGSRSSVLIERYMAKHDLHARLARVGAARPRLPRRQPLARPVPPAGAGREGRPRRGRGGDRHRDARAAAVHAREAPGRLHPRGEGEAPRLHRGLGAPEAERPGAADGPVQGPVPPHRRARGAADRPHVSDSAPRQRRLPWARPTGEDAGGRRGEVAERGARRVPAQLVERGPGVDVDEVVQSGGIERRQRVTDPCPERRRRRRGARA